MFYLLWCPSPSPSDQFEYKSHGLLIPHGNIPKQAKNVRYADSREVKLAACMKNRNNRGWNGGLKAGLPSGAEITPLTYRLTLLGAMSHKQPPMLQPTGFIFQHLFFQISHQNLLPSKTVFSETYPSGSTERLSKDCEKRCLRLESGTRAYIIKVRHQRQSELWSRN